MNINRRGSKGGGRGRDNGASRGGDIAGRNTKPEPDAKQEQEPAQSKSGIPIAATPVVRRRALTGIASETNPDPKDKVKGWLDGLLDDEPLPPDDNTLLVLDALPVKRQMPRRSAKDSALDKIRAIARDEEDSGKQG